MAAVGAMRAKSIGHYILGKTIGEGTFGKVKLGTHILTGEKVAVKILEKERIVDVADVERVAREIRILKLIQHPHVIQLYEIIETPRQLYLIMEYCSGGELFDLIVASGRVHERDACRFFQQILAGVDQIHRMNVVHRDLKPENLLLDDAKNIKIVDFGLSNTFQEGQLLKTACGSPCYAAPEMIAGQRYVPSRCDLWSCGVILFALVCGYLPFEDQNTSALYRKILNADYKPPKFISDSVRDLIAGLLTTDPEMRLTVPRVRSHPWTQQVPDAGLTFDGDRGEKQLDEEVLDQLGKFGFPKDYAVKCLQMNKHNHATTTYYLLLEKKRRMGGSIHTMATMGNACQGEFTDIFSQVANKVATQVNCENDPGTRDFVDLDAMMAHNNPSNPKENVPPLSLSQAQAQTADADRAGGCSPAPHSVRCTSTPGQAPSYSQWLQNLQTPRDARAVGGAAGRDPSTEGRPVSRGETPVVEQINGPALHLANMGPSHQCMQPNSARASTPRSAAGSAMGLIPRRRTPIQQVSEQYSARGDAPQPWNAAHTPRSARGSTPPSASTQGTRTTTPGRRQPVPSYAYAPGGGSLSARGNTRPSTSQAMAPTARRRQPSGMADSASPTVPPPLPLGSARPPNRRHPASSSGSSTRGPAAAWAAPSPAPAAQQHRSAQRPSRAASVSPELLVGQTPGVAHAGTLSESAQERAAPPLSARDHHEEAMRTCRGAFNVSCTSSKQPKQILQEIQRALHLQGVSYKQASAFLVKCQRHSLRFEMEISHLDHLENIYVVWFRRVVGELVPYKDLCSKILAEMRI